MFLKSRAVFFLQNCRPLDRHVEVRLAHVLVDRVEQERREVARALGAGQRDRVAVAPSDDRRAADHQVGAVGLAQVHGVGDADAVAPPPKHLDRAQPLEPVGDLGGLAGDQVFLLRLFDSGAGAQAHRPADPVAERHEFVAAAVARHRRHGHGLHRFGCGSGFAGVRQRHVALVKSGRPGLVLDAVLFGERDEVFAVLPISRDGLLRGLGRRRLRLRRGRGRRGERDQHRFLAGLDRGHDAVRAGLLVSRQPGETDLGFRLGRFLLQPDLLEVRPQLGVHTTLLSQNIDHA